MDPADLWAFLPVGYLETILIEMPILLLGLSARHLLKRRIFAGFWLTACTYPIVVLVLPLIFSPLNERSLYMAVAETFAPVAECLLFWAAFRDRTPALSGGWRRDSIVIVLANLASFLMGELIH